MLNLKIGYKLEDWSILIWFWNYLLSWVEIFDGSLVDWLVFQSRASTMSWKNKAVESNSRNAVMSRKLSFVLCISFFCVGMLFTDRFFLSPFPTPINIIFRILICKYSPLGVDASLSCYLSFIFHTCDGTLFICRVFKFIAIYVYQNWNCQNRDSGCFYLCLFICPPYAKFCVALVMLHWTVRFGIVHLLYCKINRDWVRIQGWLCPFLVPIYEKVTDLNKFWLALWNWKTVVESFHDVSVKKIKTYGFHFGRKRWLLHLFIIRF